MSKLAEPLGDGRYIVDPSQIEWEDVLRYEAELDKGPYPEESNGNYLTRCVRVLMGIPPDKDVFVKRHEEAITCMLKLSEHDQSGSH